MTPLPTQGEYKVPCQPRKGCFGCGLCTTQQAGNGARPPIIPLMLTATSPRIETAPKPVWLRTDDSTKQKGRQLGPGIFEFKEKRFGRKVRATIVLADYPEGRRNYYAEAYYGSLAGLMEECLDEWEFILAECIFEQISL